MIVEQVQFLDRRHLFIKFGSVDGGVNVFLCRHLTYRLFISCHYLIEVTILFL
jgi:hypothetical protein